jgi:hypothetical protein
MRSWSHSTSYLRDDSWSLPGSLLRQPDGQSRGNPGGDPTASAYRHRADKRRGRLAGGLERIGVEVGRFPRLVGNGRPAFSIVLRGVAQQSSWHARKLLYPYRPVKNTESR